MSDWIEDYENKIDQLFEKQSGFSVRRHLRSSDNGGVFTWLIDEECRPFSTKIYYFCSGPLRIESDVSFYSSILESYLVLTTILLQYINGDASPFFMHIKKKNDSYIICAETALFNLSDEPDSFSIDIFKNVFYRHIRYLERAYEVISFLCIGGYTIEDIEDVFKEKLKGKF